VKKKFIKAIVYILIFIGVIVMLMPFAWMIVTSFKLDSEVESWPPRWTSENFNFKRDLNLNLVRSEDVSIDFSALTIEEFFNLNTLLQSMRSSEKVLTYSVDDDAPYRGTMSLKLLPAANGIAYSETIDEQALNTLIDSISEENISNKDLYSFLQTITEIDDAETKISSIMNRVFYKDTSELNRKILVKNTEEKIETVMAYIEKNGAKLVNNSKLNISDEDSQELISEKESIKNYLSDMVNKFPTRVGKFKIFLDDFSKGRPILSVNEMEKFNEEYKSLFGDFISYTYDSAAWAPMRVFEKYVSSPLRSVESLVGSAITLNKYFSDAQRNKMDAFEIVFKFKPESVIKENITEEIIKADFSEAEKEIIMEIIDNNELAQTANALMAYFDDEMTDKLLEYGLSKEEALSMSNTVKEFTEELNSAISENAEFETEVIDSLLSGKSISDYFYDENIASSRGGILESRYSKINEYAKNNGINLNDLNLLIGDRYENSKLVKYYSGMYSKISTSMEIISAPEIVKDIRYKNRRSIEIVFDSVNPIWFWDETPELTVQFSFGEWLANLGQNYVNAWETGKYFGNYYFNTVLVAVLTTVLDIMFAAMAAFAFSKLKFFGRNFLFSLFLATMMVPGEVLLVPNYITLSKFGWIDTYYALIVPWTVSVFVIFLMRQHFMSIPNELYDAGKIDGISKWGFLWKVMVPLSKPVIITGSLLKFVGSWNAFLWVLIVTKSPEVRTLPVGLSNFNSDVGTLYNQLMAASTFSMLPIVILFLFVQKYFIQGISRTGLK